MVLVPEMERRRLTWDGDVPDSEGKTWERVYLVTSEAWNVDHGAEICFILECDELPEGGAKYCFKGPYRCVFDGDVFPHKLGDDKKKWLNDNVPDLDQHRKRMDAILLLLNTGKGGIFQTVPPIKGAM